MLTAAIWLILIALPLDGKTATAKMISGCCMLTAAILLTIAVNR